MTKSDHEAYQEFLNNQEQQFKDIFENDLNVFIGNVESIDPELANQMKNIKRDGVKGMKLTKQQRAELKQKFGGHCAYCGELLGDKWHADHIEAVKRDLIHVGGGKLISGEMTRPQNDTIENMNPACVPCNTNKSSMPLEGWRKMLTHYRDVQLLRDSTHARHLLRFGLIEIKSEPVVFFFEKGASHE